MTLTSRRLRPLDMKAEAEQRRRERLFTPHPDEAVRRAAALLVTAGKVPTETFDSTYARAVSDGGNVSPAARRRDAAALAGSSEGWTRQSLHLARSYDHALGWALAYGITTYTVTERGVHMKGLHELCTQVRAHEAVYIEAQRQIEAAAAHEAEVQGIVDRLSLDADGC